MKNAAKATGITLAALMVILTGVGVWLWASQFGALKPLVESQLSSQLGRQVEIYGGFRIAVDLKPTLVAYNVSVANSEWGSRPEMIRAERIELEFELLPLLREGRLVAPRLLVENPSVLLERAGEKANWTFKPDAPSGQPPAAPEQNEAPNFNLLNVDIRDGMITYRSETDSNGTTLRIDRLQWHSVRATDRLKVMAEGNFRDRAWTLSGTVGSIADFLNYGDGYPLDLRGNIAEMDLSAQGSLRLSDGAQAATEPLSLALSVPEISDVEDWTGLTLPFAGEARIATEVVRQRDRYVFRNIAVGLDDMEASGNASVTLGDVPKVDLSLSSEHIDLSRLLKNQPEEDGATSETWHSAMTNWFPSPEMFSGFAAAAHIKIDRALLRDTALSDVTASLHLGNGEFSVKPLRFDIGSGSVSTTFQAYSGGARELALTADVQAVPPSQVDGLTGLDLRNSISEPLSGTLSLKARHPGDRPVFSGSLNIDTLALRNATDIEADRSDNLFDDTLIQTGWLRGYSAQVSLGISQLELENWKFRDVNATGHVDEGVLTLDPVSFNLADGAGDAVFRLDGGTDPLAAALSLQFDGLDVGMLLAELGAQDTVTGTAQLQAELQSRGNSVNEIAAALGGQGSVVVTDGQILDTRLNLLISDLDILRILPFVGGGGDHIDANCFVGGMKFNDGVGTSTIVLDTPEMVLTGEGELDLARERLNVVLRPHAKSEKLSTVSIPVRLHGSITSPNVEAFEIKRNAAKSFIGGLALPLNFLSRFLPNNSDDAQACARAMEDIEVRAKEDE